MIDIIIPTLKKPHLQDCLDSLKKYTKVPYRLFLISEGKNWPEAINIGLKRCGLNNDVVLIDDDVQVLPGWLNNIEEYKKKADIIGFKLLRPDKKRIDHAGCIVTFDPLRGIYGKIFNKEKYFISINTIGLMEYDFGQYDKEKFLPHVTTSLIYIKKRVFQTIGGMNVWEGQHHEDWDFSFRALNAGFKIMYSPNKAIHICTATKSSFSDFNDKSLLNYKILHSKWLQNKEFIRLLRKKGFIKFKLWKFRFY